MRSQMSYKHKDLLTFSPLTIIFAHLFESSRIHCITHRMLVAFGGLCSDAYEESPAGDLSVLCGACYLGYCRLSSKSTR